MLDLTTNTPRSARPRWLDWATLAAQGLLAIGFIAAGGQKVLSTSAMVDMFAEIGAGQGFRWLIGLVEIAAAILVVMPATAFWGAALIVCIMLGAIFTHLVLIGGTFLPALMLLALAAFVAWMRRSAR